MQTPKIDPSEAHRTMLLVWSFMLVSHFLWLGVVWIVKPELMRFDLSEPFITKQNFILITVAALLAIISFLVSLVRNKRNLAEAIGRQEVALVQKGMIEGCTFSDLITLIGMLLAFAFDYQWFFLWFLLGIGATILHYPSRKNIDAASYKTI
jgi:hypothetical protein